MAERMTPADTKHRRRLRRNCIRILLRILIGKMFVFLISRHADTAPGMLNRSVKYLHYSLYRACE